MSGLQALKDGVIWLCKRWNTNSHLARPLSIRSGIDANDIILTRVYELINMILSN